MRDVIIGVDGGGTYTRLAAVDGQGHILGRSMCGSINYNNLPVEECRNNLLAGLDGLLSGCGLKHYDHLAIGMSALSGPATAAELHFFAGNTLPQEKLLLDSDVFMALMGATLGKPGIMVISGTGTMSVGWDAQGQVHLSGGWGYLLGDEGSSYYIAYRALLSAIHAYEGWGEETDLTKELLCYFGVENMRALIDRLYNPLIPVSELAGVSQSVISCARQGDAQARKIIDDTVSILKENTAYLIRKLGRDTDRVSIYGGLFEYNPDIVAMYTEALHAQYPLMKVGFPEFKPEIGAAIHYFITAGRWNDAILHELRRTKDAAESVYTGKPKSLITEGGLTYGGV